MRKHGKHSPKKSPEAEIKQTERHGVWVIVSGLAIGIDGEPHRIRHHRLDRLLIESNHYRRDVALNAYGAAKIAEKEPPMAHADGIIDLSGTEGRLMIDLTNILLD